MASDRTRPCARNVIFEPVNEGVMMSEPLQIQVDGTPNPHAVKFTLNRVVTEQGKTYRGDPAAVDAAWAKALLSIPGIVGVYGVNTFISVSKTSEMSWDAIVPKAEAALKQVFA